MLERKEHLAHFQTIIQALNPEQRLAVETVEGPVLTIAGPGTGKTHILTARVGQILLQTDAQAHNVLCLTFTDAGVQAMRQRLLSFIGPEAHRVHIYTFHSFCNKIIQENLERFGKYDLRPLGDLERVEVIRRILEQLPLDHALRKVANDPYFYERHLQDLFQRMKAERWTAKLIQEQAQTYLAELPQKKEYIYQRNTKYAKAGELKKELLEEQHTRMERLVAAAELFEHYQAELDRRRRYDYDDMILWVLDGFDKDDYLLRLYQEQYLYLLVDEFQDTNGAQNNLIHRLMDYWEDFPNIFIVGDDDQSIFEFQGARLKHISEFFSKYQNNLTIALLRENYRSAQTILDAAQALIEHNENRLINNIQADGFELNKHLFASNSKVAKQQNNVKILAYPNRIQEEAGLIRQIQSLQKQGVALNEIAILYAQHKQSLGLVRLLERYKIPYRSRRRINILEQPLIVQLRRLLEYIGEEDLRPGTLDEVLYEILHYPFLGIEPMDLRSLAWHLAKKKDGQQRAWFEAIRDKTWLESLDLLNTQAIHRVAAFLDQLHYDFREYTLPEFLERVINHSGLLGYLQGSGQVDWHLEVLNTLFEFAQQESYKNPYLNLRDFLDMLKRMESNAIALGVYRSTYAEDGVNLLTTHSAKGLEFGYVFMVHCIDEYWEPVSNRARRFPLPDTLTFSLETDEMEAARRLFYVGLTRAKVFLQLSYHEKNEDEKPLNRARFLDELELRGGIALQATQVPKTWINQLLAQQLSLPQVPADQWLDAANVDALLADFKLTVSALNTYLNCPLSFYYEYVLRLPSNPSKEAAYGIALHNVLKRLFDQAQKNSPKTLPDDAQALEYFHQEMERSRNFFHPMIYRQYLEQGVVHLTQYLNQRRTAWDEQLQVQEVFSEKSLRQLDIEGVPVVGIIDKLILYNDPQRGYYWKVVDYKTGRSDEQRLEAPSDKQPQGGFYYRQLLFYKLLVEQSPLFNRYPVKMVEIDYLFPNKQGIFEHKELSVNSEDSHWMRRLIKETYQKIRQQEFKQGCGKPHCKWCQLAKRQVQVDSFRNEIAEAMDDV